MINIKKILKYALTLLMTTIALNSNNVTTKAKVYDSHEKIMDYLYKDTTVQEELKKLTNNDNKEFCLKKYSINDAVEVIAILDLWKFNTLYKEKKSMIEMETKLSDNDVTTITIPGITEDDEAANIDIVLENGKFDKDDIIVGYNTGDCIKVGIYKTVEEKMNKVSSEKIVNIRKIRIDKAMDLLHITTADDNLYVIPYNSFARNMIEEMGLKEGKIYTEKQFADAFKDTYKDWTDEEIEKYKKENSGKIGGPRDMSQLLKLTDSAKKRLANEDNKDANSFLKMSNKTIVISAGIVVAVVLGVIVALLVKKNKARKRSNHEIEI